MAELQVTHESDEIESVAIVGMSARFAGARNLAEFWKNLCDGRETITYFSAEELIADGRNPLQINQPNYVKAHPMLEDFDQFDAAFFNIPPGEAALLDPQHRVFLECAWEALEDAGYTPQAYGGWIGMFTGCSASTYLLENLWPNRALLGSVGFLQVSVANSRDYLPTRVSYKLNLKGPSVNLNTACSTSLVATHLACQSLLSYQCDMALAGGVAIDIPQKAGYVHQQGSMFSPDGHCRPFDAQAEGTVFGSGAGVIVLKRLSDALRDGDQIYAVIKGSAINNDGSSKVGFTAPGLEGQVRVIAMAQAAANVDPETISYVEAHGTGTSLGDPIEVEALTQAFRAHTDKKQFCGIGSVKGNIGHTDAAAGVANLIKVSLSLSHKKLPPSINYHAPNPKIDFANSPFYVNAELHEWQSEGRPRRAGVNAFGIGGTNAHAVLEEAPAIAASSESRPHQLLVLSARTETALEATIDRLAADLQAHPDRSLADVAYTLQVGRQAFEKRCAVVCESPADAVAVLQMRDATRLLTSAQVKPGRPVVFMFSGQGAQYVNMGRDLYQREAVFRKQVDTCAEQLKPHLGLDLREVLYPQKAAAAQAAEQLDQTWLTQPALFTIEYALAQTWMSWGVKPRAMIGHSIGEYVAACLAGVFSLQDALALVAARGRLMQSAPPGVMLSVPLPEDKVQSWLNGALALATVNTPSSCVVAGPSEAIAAFESQMAEEGIACRRLHTSHAFHSPMMDSIVKPFEKQVGQVKLRPPQLPYISNVTGVWITPEQATDPAYWAQHLRQPVRFSEGVGVLAQSPDDVLLEIGPGNTLRTLAQRHPGRALEQPVLSSMRHPQETQDDQTRLLQAAGQLWLTGASIHWPAFYRGERRLRVALPTYPFERERHWVEARSEAAAQAAPLFKNPDIAAWFYTPSWKRSMPPTLESAAVEGSWLLFSDGGALSARLAEYLRSMGAQVAIAFAGEEFKAGDDAYTIRPGARADYDALLAALGGHGQSPTRIVHLWNVASLGENVAGFTDEALRRSFYSLLFLAQAIGKQSDDRDVRLAVVSSQMQHVASEETVHPEKATLLGPCKIIPQEMQRITCRSIDIILPAAGSRQEIQLVEQLIAEIESDSPGSILAYRGYDRWVQTYEPAPLAEVQDRIHRRLRERGVYLITGGLGGIGLALAQYLAQAAQARLVLTSRSRFPEREVWDQWLVTHDPRDRTSGHIRAIQALEAAGAEVWVAQADVSDRAQMGTVVRAAHERFGAIHGVIHSAGIPGGGVIQLKTEAAAAGVLAPKVQGTYALEAALRGIPLDFMLLCSSLTSITGDLGQVDYCAANAFMDAFAHARSDRDGYPIISLNWDAWAEVGMAVNTPANLAALLTQAAPSTRPVDHPMLARCYQEAEKRTVYEMELSPARNWVLSDHMLMGIPTVPGTTHLELARAAFVDLTHSGQIEISEAMFLTPMTVGQGTSKEARLVMEQQPDGFGFQVISKFGVAANGEAIWQPHVMGRVGSLSGVAPRQYDIEAIRARCTAMDMAVTPEDIARNTEGFLKFGPRWDTLKHLQFGENEGIALIELDEKFLSDLDGFQLHPAMLDIATSFAGGALGVTGRYLPLSYRHARIFDKLPRRLYSYIRARPGSPTGGETLTTQVTLVDETGRGVVEVDEFTLMRVDDAAIARLQGGAAGGASAADAPQPAANAPYSRDLNHAILPQEGAQAFQRVLCYNRLPQLVVCTRHLPTLIERASQLTQETMLEQAQAQTPRTKHARPSLQTRYVAPRSAIESRLAVIWREALGIEEVGIRDNFFELGGDSVLGIQVVAKVREAGFQINPELLFQNQTIADLANVLQPSGPAEDRSELPLTSYQLSLLSQEAHSSHILVLEAEANLNPAMLEQALSRVLARHDALRLRFTREGDGWHQMIDAQADAVGLTIIDLSGSPIDDPEEATSAEMMRLQHSLETLEPPLLRATLLRLGADRADRLILAVSPLSADAAGLPILLEDVYSAYHQAAQAEPDSSPAPTVTFAEWAGRLAAYARSDELQTGRAYWRAIAERSAEPLPVDASSSGEAHTLAARLSPEHTLDLQALGGDVNIQPEEAILAALAQVLIHWSGRPALWLRLSRFQREAVLGDLDTSRLIGALRVDCPLYLDASGADDPDDFLKAVKEQARQAELHSAAYALLRATDEAFAGRPSVAFTYCPPVPDDPLFQLVADLMPDEQAGDPIWLCAGIRQGQLRLTWRYDSGLYCKETIARLNTDVMAALQELIRHRRETGHVQFTPSDFPQAELDQEALDQFLAKLGQTPQ